MKIIVLVSDLKQDVNCESHSTSCPVSDEFLHVLPNNGHCQHCNPDQL